MIPLIHFVLLGFLPMDRMRRSRAPAYAAGCGQLFLARREAYEQVGGHAAIRSTWHDGIKLPRAFRAREKDRPVRRHRPGDMPHVPRAGAVWHGLAKNATEGLASPRMIIPATVLLACGQIVPAALLAGAAHLSPAARTLAGSAMALAYATRLAGVIRFRQSLLGAVLHPIGVGVLIAIQWYALARCLLGRSPTWKGRRRQTALMQENCLKVVG